MRNIKQLRSGFFAREQIARDLPRGCMAREMHQSRVNAYEYFPVGSPIILKIETIINISWHHGMDLSSEILVLFII